MIRYLVDTGALFEAKKVYPPDSFGDSLWETFRKLNSEGRLIIIDKVKEEISRGSENDYLITNFIGSAVVMKTEIPEILTQLGIVQNCLPPGFRTGLEQWNKAADPWLIATCMHLALTQKGEEILLIQEERDKPGKIKIPTICKVLNMKCFRSYEIIIRENLKFGLK